jgi:hypothetical protein
MQRVDRKLMGLLVALTPLVGACSADLGLNVPSPQLTMQRPDWLSYSGNKTEFTLRAVTQNDLIGAQGQCAPDPLTTAGAPRSADEGGIPMVQGGIALQMTECDVVRRAGAPDNIQLSSTDRGEREIALTYTGGSRPGVYRFAGGRLYSIEAVAAPAAPPGTAKTAKRPTRG